jgi:DNA polymerase (family X)
MTNKELGRHLRDLQAFLVIAGYDEVHARRYMHISHEIESMDEEIEVIWREGRLLEIQGVGPSVAAYLKEILETGKSSKQEEWEKVVPFTVVELLRIPGLGIRTAQRLVNGFGIYSLAALKNAIDSGLLKGAPGIGEKTVRTWREALATHLRE